jgi:hypothetical protein
VQSVIPSDRKSVPLNLKQMAGYYKGGMTPKKLKAIIQMGTLTVETLTRETFVFDIAQLPDYVREKVKP